MIMYGESEKKLFMTYFKVLPPPFSLRDKEKLQNKPVRTASTTSKTGTRYLMETGHKCYQLR